MYRERVKQHQTTHQLGLDFRRVANQQERIHCHRPILDELVAPGHLRQVIESSGVVQADYQVDEINQVAVSNATRSRSRVSESVIRSRRATLAAVVAEVNLADVDRPVNRVHFAEQLPSKDDDETWNFPTGTGNFSLIMFEVFNKSLV